MPRYPQLWNTVDGWAQLNPSPILAMAELGVEYDPDNNSFRIKIGDGQTRWIDLNYYNFDLDQQVIAQMISAHNAASVVHSNAFQNITPEELSAGVSTAPRLITAANLKLASELFGLSKISTVHVVTATLTPESGKHYICTGDVELLDPEDISPTTLWKCTMFLEYGATISYPGNWMVSGNGNPNSRNHVEITVANGTVPMVRWLTGSIGGSTLPGEESPSVVYVSKMGSDSNTGLSWGQAKLTIQAGIDAAYDLGKEQVWIATGTYNSGETYGFNIYSGISLYGGFVGDENSLADRPVTSQPIDNIYGCRTYTYPTVLSNSLSVNANALCCLYGYPRDATEGTCVISGITFTDCRRVFMTKSVSVPATAVSYSIFEIVDCLFSNITNTVDGVNTRVICSHQLGIRYCSFVNLTTSGINLECISNTPVFNCYFNNLLVGKAVINDCNIVSNTLFDAFHPNSLQSTSEGFCTKSCRLVYKCKFTNMSGTGYPVSFSDINHMILNCVFENSRRGINGSSGTIHGCLFIGRKFDHTSTDNYLTFSSPVIVQNCIFAAHYGVRLYNSSPGGPNITIDNCMFLHCRAGTSGSPQSLFELSAGTITIRNCVAFVTSTVMTTSGSKILDAANCVLPGESQLAHFVDPANVTLDTVFNEANYDAIVAKVKAHGYRSVLGAPQINRGNNAHSLFQYDILENPRISGASIDAGPYEYQE